MTDRDSKSGSNRMWGGRFGEGPAAIMAKINASIGFDKRLWRQDIAGSRAHAAMLVQQGIISADDGAAIDHGLAKIGEEYERDGVAEVPDLEDIHMHTEARLAELIGPAAGRLHTARSRNDQVATAFRLWVRDASGALIAGLDWFEAVLLDRAEEQAATIMPGFTHLQVAQPITLGHHLMAWREMIARDMERFADARRRNNACPLGSAALAGTGFPVDREATAQALGFSRPAANSLDAVSDRDFALDFLAACAVCSVHLSRIAEELVLWASPPFGFVRLPDAWSTGSSIMPQKRNPDAAELVRGHAGPILGCLTALLITMKGLPLAYSKDLQDDKEPVFDAHDRLALCLAALSGMVAEVEFDPDRMLLLAQSGHATATDLADWLVRELDLPFREAHHITGAAVRAAEERGVGLSDLSRAELAAIDARLEGCALPDLSVEASVASRTSAGGTTPVRVREAIAQARAERAERRT